MNWKFEDQTAVEHLSKFFKLRQGSDFIEIFTIQPTFANEKRHYDFEIINEQNQALNVTVKQITETRIVFELFNPTSNKDTQLIINGSQLGGVFIDNSSLTEGAGGSSTWDFDPTVLPFFGQKNTIVIDNNVINATVVFPASAETTFAVHGRNLEGNFLNTLTRNQQEVFYNLLEFYEPDSKILDQLVEDIKVDKQRAYELIGKINSTGFYLNDSGLQNGSGTFKDKYLASNSISEFYTNLEQTVRNSLPPEVED